MTGVTISLRSSQSTPLTSQQVDANFQNLADAVAGGIDLVSVRGFGAVGDGTTDDTDAIQRAIDTVSTAGGGKVIIPAGKTFMVSARNVAGIAAGVAGIVMKDNVTLQLDGTIIVKANSYGNGAFYAAIRSLDSGLSNAAIVGSGKVDGNKANQIASQQCSNIFLVCKLNVRVDGINSINANGMGIQFVAPTSSTHTGCAITNCWVSDSTNIGIQISHALLFLVSGNRVRNCANNGIDIYGDDGSLGPDTGIASISNNVVDNVLVGVFIETTSRVSVIGNAVNGSYYGFCVNRIHGAPTLVTVSGNTVSTCGTAGQITGDSGGVTVDGNSFGFTGVGLQLGGGGGNVSYVTVINNFFLPNSTTADLVNVAGNTAGFVILRNNYYKDNSHDQAHLTVTPVTTKVACSFEPIISVNQGYRPMPKIFNGTGTSGGTSTITMPDVWIAGQLVIKATSGGAWDSVWEGSVIANNSRVAVTQKSTTFTTPGNAVNSVVGSSTTRDVTVTWTAIGSPITWVAYLEYF